MSERYQKLKPSELSQSSTSCQIEVDISHLQKRCWIASAHIDLIATRLCLCHHNHYYDILFWWRLPLIKGCCSYSITWVLLFISRAPDTLKLAHGQTCFSYQFYSLHNDKISSSLASLVDIFCKHVYRFLLVINSAMVHQAERLTVRFRIVHRFIVYVVSFVISGDHQLSPDIIKRVYKND